MASRLYFPFWTLVLTTSRHFRPLVLTENAKTAYYLYVCMAYPSRAWPLDPICAKNCSYAWLILDQISHIRHFSPSSGDESELWGSQIGCRKVPLPPNILVKKWCYPTLDRKLMSQAKFCNLNRRNKKIHQHRLHYARINQNG